MLMKAYSKFSDKYCSPQLNKCQFSCICSVIDNDLCHNVVKVHVAERCPATLPIHVMTKFMIKNRTDALKTDVNLVFFDDNKLSALTR